MNLRSHDHQATRDFLTALEAGETKALAIPVFAGFGPSGSTGGWHGGGTFGPVLPGAKYDYQAEAGDLKRNSAVAIGLSWAGNNFAEAPVRVKRRNAAGDEEWIQDHPIERLAKRPNPKQTWHTISKGALADFKSWGDAFFLVAKGLTYRPGDPIELWWLPRIGMRPRCDSNGMLVGWTYTVNNRRIDLELDEILHIQDGIDPLNPWFGLSALQSCLREVCTDNEAATYTAALLRNFGIAGYMVSPKNPEATLGERTDREFLVKDLKNRTTGERRGDPVVFNTALQIDMLGYSPEQLVLDKIRQVPESRLAAALGLPAMIVGLAVGADQKTYSNYAEARQAAYEDCICPCWREWATALGNHLLPDMGDAAAEWVEFDTSRIAALQENEDSKVTRATAVFEKGLATKNEARKLLGLPPTTNGDCYSDGSKPEPDAGDDVAGGPKPADGQAVQDQALNGAQIDSLSGLLTAVATGQIPSASARGVMLVAYPTMDPTEADAILGPLQGFKPTPPPEPATKPGQPAKKPADDDDDEETDKAVKALLPELAAVLKTLGPRP